MKLLTALGALLFSSIAFSQEVPHTAPATTKKIQIGINFSSDYCDSKIVNSNGNSNLDGIVESFEKLQIGKFGYSTGVNLSYNVSNRFGLEAGIQYSNKGFATEKMDLFFGDQIDPRYGFTYDSISGSTPSGAQSLYSYHYLDIPLRAYWIVGEKRMKFIASLGVTTNILLKATQTFKIKYDNGDTEVKTTEQSYDYRAINISPTASVGIVYRLSNSFDLRLEPTFRYGVIKINDEPIARYLWNAGLNFSCYYTIR